MVATEREVTSMARRTAYDETQAAQRLKVPVTAFRWARHAGIVPAPDLPPGQWSRAMVEALDAGAVRAAMNQEPLLGREAADRIAAALGTPNKMSEKAAVTSFVVRRFITRGLLTDLSGNPKGTLHHPGQVAGVCMREDLAELVAADTPLGPDQAADRLGVRRVEFDWMVKLKWLRATEWAEVQYGTSRAGAVDVPLYRTADVDALPGAHPRSTGRSSAGSRRAGARRSPPCARRRRRRRCRGWAGERGGCPGFPGGRPLLVCRSGQAGVEEVRTGWSMWWCSMSTPYAPCLPDEPPDRLRRRDTPVTAALARHREADQTADGDFVGQGPGLDGGPVEQSQDAGGLQDVGVDIVVQAGAVVHRRGCAGRG
ncbi:hypothetical protein [Streptomyces sp. NPDC088752]|uniref:hypothetical protein n=1 Tax=Streptomyces sp. NPDC088752 TaxID=3154963 RepID=UPI0034145978